MEWYCHGEINLKILNVYMYIMLKTVFRVASKENIAITFLPSAVVERGRRNAIVRMSKSELNIVELFNEDLNNIKKRDKQHECAKHN